MNEQKFSEEFLNAFVDDQLDPEEKGRALLELSRDEALSRQVCELRKLRDLVRMAYADVQPPAESRVGRRQRRLSLSVAAAIVLALGMALGWTLHQRPTAALPTVQAPGTLLVETPQTDANDAQLKIVVHLTESAPKRIEQTLDEVESLIKLYRSNGQLVRVELVANGDGLALLRSDLSPAPERVRRMQQEYDNLTFIACQNTIDRVNRDTGIVAKLLPGVVVIDSGVAQLMRRQKQGWAYIQA
jgi:intracellular sulfur oxidation DsrE/DsrF family protein